LPQGGTFFKEFEKPVSPVIEHRGERFKGRYDRPGNFRAQVLPSISARVGGVFLGGSGSQSKTIKKVISPKRKNGR